MVTFTTEGGSEAAQQRSSEAENQLSIGATNSQTDCRRSKPIAHSMILCTR